MPFEQMPQFEKPNEKRSLEFRRFLAEQVSLSPDKWDEKFKDYMEEKYKEAQKEIPERTSEEERELTFRRYLKGLDLTEEELKNKKILDLGCGEEGIFVKECLKRQISQEAYGIDLLINSDTLEEKDKNHFFKDDFEKEFPIKNLDYVLSAGAVEAPFDELNQSEPEKTLLEGIDSIKDTGEIRIFPIRNTYPESEHKGIRFARQKWDEILNELADKKKIEYEIKPIDIRVGINKDVWLEEVLILKKELNDNKEVIREEKARHWQEAKTEVEKIADKLGKPIDEGIKEAIIAFKSLGINTIRSCEGHMDHGAGGPYIDIEAKEVEDLEKHLDEVKDNEEKFEKIIEEITRNNLKERKKIMTHLSNFYKERNVPYDKRLIINPMGRGWSRIESQGAGLQKIEPEGIKKEKLSEYQQEMRDFSQFLKEKFFS